MTKPSACAVSRQRKTRWGMRKIIFATVLITTTAAVGSLDSARAELSCSDMYARCMNFCKTQRPVPKCFGFCPTELESCKQTGTFNNIKGSFSGLKRN